MSTVQAFFKQRQKDQSSGKSSAETIAALRSDGNQPLFQYAHVAIQGCCHGELTRIYDACAAHEAETGKKIDFLICCGDFQAIRTNRDLSSMAVPDKYKTLGDFPQYFPADGSSAPRKTAPYLTLFVGGNHENSDWLAEESYGGYLAPNIYYLGHSGVVEVELPITSSSSPSSSTADAEGKTSTGVVVVGGLSGIFKGIDYERPYPPRPYAVSENGKRSAYHVRRIEQEKLEAFIATMARDRHERRTTQARTQPDSAQPSPPPPLPAQPMEAPLIDILVSHDWPVGITKLGDEEQLLRYKPYFKDDIAHHALGNPHTLNLLRAARPRYWIAAHLHCFFTAQVPVVVPPAQLAGEPNGAAATSSATSFIALDKCAKAKGFLDFVDVPLHWSEAQLPSAEAGAPSLSTPSAASSRRHPFPRVRRHPVWLQVLRLSHPFVAQNLVGPDGFTAAEATFQLTTQDRDDSHAPPVPCATLYAESTASLLNALRLDPALPLQGTGRPHGGGGGDRQGGVQPQSSQRGPPFHPPWRSHGLDQTSPGATGSLRAQPEASSHQPYARPAMRAPPQAAPAQAPPPVATVKPTAEKEIFEDAGDMPWVVDLGSGSS